MIVHYSFEVLYAFLYKKHKKTSGKFSKYIHSPATLLGTPC